MNKKITLFCLFLLPFLSFAQENEKQSKFIINSSIGYAWRTAEKPSGISSQEKDFLNELSSGIHFDIGAYYMIKQDWGIGLKYNQFTSSAEGTFQLTVLDNIDSTIQTLRIKEDDKITFIGSGIFGGNFSNETKHKYIAGMALGYISYKSVVEGVEVKGGNLGLTADLGYQYQFSPSFSVGPQLGVTAGTITKFKVQGQTIELDEDSKEGLHRVSISLGATLRF